MSLASVAMFNHDMYKALEYYDKCDTPHAAFNQCQVGCWY